jgi:RND family efflux transporter MFP subunit
MRVKAQVEETDIPMVREGQRAEIYLDAYPDLVFHGEVVQVGVEAETGSGGTTVFPVVVQMEYTDIPLRLGYNATVDIEVLFKEDVITVPVTALVTWDDGDYVFVVEEGKARLRRVETGERTDEWIEIVSGLEPGERIVVEGAGKVSEGQKVE